MKTIRKAAIGTLIGAALAATAPAHAAGDLRADLLGEAVTPSTTPDRTIEVTPRTRWINVSYGETVRFVMPQAPADVVWRFDGRANNLQLAEIAPGTPRNVTVYVDQARNSLVRENESG